MFGVWESKSNDTVYQATTDGFVCAWSSASTSYVTGFTDSNNPPTVARVANSSGDYDRSGITMPVRKGDYWKVTDAQSVYWIPLGT